MVRGFLVMYLAVFCARFYGMLFLPPGTKNFSLKNDGCVVTVTCVTNLSGLLIGGCLSISRTEKFRRTCILSFVHTCVYFMLFLMFCVYFLLVLDCLRTIYVLCVTCIMLHYILYHSFIPDPFKSDNAANNNTLYCSSMFFFFPALGEFPTSHPSIKVASSCQIPIYTASLGTGFYAFATVMMQVLPRRIDPFKRRNMVQSFTVPIGHCEGLYIRGGD